MNKAGKFLVKAHLAYKRSHLTKSIKNISLVDLAKQKGMLQHAKLRWNLLKKCFFGLYKNFNDLEKPRFDIARSIVIILGLRKGLCGPINNIFVDCIREQQGDVYIEGDKTFSCLECCSGFTRNFIRIEKSHILQFADEFIKNRSLKIYCYFLSKSRVLEKVNILATEDSNLSYQIPYLKEERFSLRHFIFIYLQTALTYFKAKTNCSELNSRICMMEEASQCAEDMGKRYKQLFIKEKKYLQEQEVNLISTYKKNNHHE